MRRTQRPDTSDKMSLSPALAPKFPERVTLGPDEVVVVTGGSGFLGQHIMRVLNERADGIKEIRIVDLVPYAKKLEFDEIHNIKFFKTDITVEDQLDEPFNGATCVIHCAAVVDVGHYVDRLKMMKTNMIGTKNVVFKCRQWNVPKLVLTSSVDAVLEHDSIFVNQSEGQTKLPVKEKKLLMGYYAFTKAQSEAIVICSRNSPMANGKRIKTAILRPTVLYGELDTYYVPQTLKVAKSTFGYLPQPLILVGEPVLQSTYAGNAAWAHVLAVWKLNEECKEEEPVEEWREVDGQSIFLNDDTHPSIIYDFMKPFLALRGMSTIQLPIPLFMMFFWLLSMSYVIKMLPDSFKKYLNQKPLIPTIESFNMAHKAVHFNRIKSTNCLEYTPIYSEEKALELSSRYYKDVPL